MAREKVFVSISLRCFAGVRAEFSLKKRIRVAFTNTVPIRPRIENLIITW